MICSKDEVLLYIHEICDSHLMSSQYFDIVQSSSEIPRLWQGRGNLLTRLLHKVVTRLLLPVHNLVVTLNVKLFPYCDNLVATLQLHVPCHTKVNFERMVQFKDIALVKLDH